MTTYEVIANNCNTMPSIKYSRKGLSKAMAIFCACNLARGFRQVDVLNDETGEVVLANYVGEDFFENDMTPTEAINTIEAMFD